MVTPFGADGSLDVEGARRLAEHLVDVQRCDGLVLNGTTGESPTTDDAEKAALVRAVVEAVGDRASVVAGVGTSDTRHTVALAQEAVDAGADGLLVVTPYYSRPPQAHLERHLHTVADATGAPVMLYDIPARTGTALETDTLIALAAHPRIVAVKDAKGDLAASTRVMDETDLVYYCGVDELNLPAYATGQVGAVSVTAHVLGARIAEMFDAFDAGRLDDARRIDRAVLRATTAIMGRTQGLVAIKALLATRGLPAGTPRPPLYAAEDELRAAIEAEVKEAG
ncbi:4-hydroxy-tetrahydrodipicolinate synthase [Stackebrandtia albiflava]